ncbi:Zuotin [Coemansia sp. RSA 1807]|nr:Zuotin [Coemansia sp. RSA 2167]KAJ2135094.1 Zuotin [Coemansia sp. RSA 788]KAJ2141235.1 Zuotin [Coemansia sp. RSA 564]KAJ2154245.1 Zuotin [Coemansia sp. RSA 637]KAJ2164158.1 Zuotin [Coemansia sp. RSA 562]KAJ2188077.1 Zuotin [Coemansia sp. RSA 532]KAJ2202832.1 Zuotin [Coemansia sp. RSA 521]KAJ2227227.1 Zuotin [Coemansia sp. RSA 518]KAJ2246676.1 Zuotin [Coemansia sp. RSA 475]KAJ2270031.1 Zuotin [Coemansia sp. RSA 371]KAJ2272182.1 Zuotin [Coemansia sp. RSA 451]KAJ2280323.1 Zuotin [Coemans
MTFVPFEITLSAAPETAPAAGAAKVHASLSAPVQREVSPIGVYVQHYLRRLEKNDASDRTDHLQHHADHEAAEAANAVNDLSLDDDEEEEEDADLLSLDPKEWKQQDHYQVLGLSKLRYRATLEDIIKSHRKKVLRHHPDKKAAQGHLNDDRFFKCIQKAFDILTDDEKRRQWDSVDPEVSTDIPTGKEKGDFFAVYAPVFERESRFSKVTPVPVLGDAEAARDDVEAFYEFWYSFDSWRTFEYLDKEDVGGGGNRDDKRYIDTKNRKERANRKKEDGQRVRTFVDNALKADPRMARFKEEDKQKRNARRNAREDEDRKAREAKVAAEEAAKQAAVAAVTAEQDEKKSRQDAHKQFKKEQRQLKLAFKNAAFFGDVTAFTAKLDKILAAKKDVDALVAVRTEIEAAHAAGNGAAVVDEIVAKL